MNVPNEGAHLSINHTCIIIKCSGVGMWCSGGVWSPPGQWQYMDMGWVGVWSHPTIIGLTFTKIIAFEVKFSSVNIKAVGWSDEGETLLTSLSMWLPAHATYPMNWHWPKWARQIPPYQVPTQHHT